MLYISIWPKYGSNNNISSSWEWEYSYLDEQTMEKAMEPSTILTGMQVAPAKAMTESTVPLHAGPVYCDAMTQ